ncbi:MAG: hypothetical protein J5679_03160 [Alphaproteobacteria bacterium]|nr:hypothetical protein [Alphaproteobacteria bacterium]
MITNSQTWHAFDKLAMVNSVSVSGLARRSGLDPTTFNKSKRVFPSGKERWPSMCTLVKVLNSLHMTFADFAKLFPDDDDKMRD